MIDLQTNALLSELVSVPAETARNIAEDTVETLISAALALPTEQFTDLQIFVLPEGPMITSTEIGEMAAAYAISPTQPINGEKVGPAQAATAPLGKEGITRQRG